MKQCRMQKCSYIELGMGGGGGGEQYKKMKWGGITEEINKEIHK
jgi:hypothetical protein